MRKFMLMAALLVATVAANAQDGKMAAGINVNYGTQSGYNALGLGAKFQYEFVDKIRSEVSGNYFLPKDDTNIWDLNLNFHYLVSLGDKANFYPLAGLAYQTVAITGDTKKALKAMGASSSDLSDSNIGFNIGVGAEYFVTNNIKVNAEVKYQYVKDSDWPVFSIGAAYVF